MLELAGRVAAGTTTWMVGPDSLAADVVPAVTKAAANSGRPAPRIVAGAPICVTDDVDAARAVASAMFEVYGLLPAYKATLARDRRSSPVDAAIIGDEDTVAAELGRYRAAGVTDFGATIIAPTASDEARTWALLGGIAAETPTVQ
jgi:alkanesulfonate monooxygenase SsuD/methylene tetrahydromethanopterin reductase-like flavin-dependent oxidoreductase (luciferase family)